MRKQQREITTHQRETSKQKKNLFQVNAINDVKQISFSHVIRRWNTMLPFNFISNKLPTFHQHNSKRKVKHLRTKSV